MLKNMEMAFLDIAVERVQKITGTEVNSYYTRNTYNLPYFIGEMIETYIKHGKTEVETVKMIEIKEATNQQHYMY